MTREEARAFLYKKMRSYSGKIEINKELVDLIEVDELINKIYNDFKNRVCKNCKWFEKKDEEERFWDKELIGYCKKSELWNGLYKRIEVDDFGCNRFERKENESIE